MRIIRNLFDHRRVWRSLNDYPVYSPPFRSTKTIFTREEIKANYDYFLEQKATRLDYLAKFLASFSIKLCLTRDALPGLDHWLFRYGGHLIPNGEEVIFALAYFEPPWAGDYLGLNIINDISIFAGEYIVSKNNDVRWDVWYGDGKKHDYEEKGFGQPCLFGLSHFAYRGHYSMLRGIYECCDAGHWRLRNGARGAKWEWDIPGEFVRRLDYLADPTPPPPIPVSQRTIDD